MTSGPTSGPTGEPTSPPSRGPSDAPTSPGAGREELSQPTLAALQETLAAEHAAVYVFGVLGGRVSRSAQPALADALSAAYAAHRARRDHLTGLIAEAGAEPVSAEPAYEVPNPLDSPPRVARVALTTERRCATTYAWLVAHTVTQTRRWAIAALDETAVRELAFGGAPETFPGIPQ